MESFRKINCMRGCAWKLSSGIVPFGNVSHFFGLRRPECAVVTRMAECSFSALVAESSLPTQLNFVLKPKPYYADPLKSVFEEPAAEKKTTLIACFL